MPPKSLTFFNRRRQGLEGKARDLVLKEFDNGNDVKVAIIFAHGDQLFAFRSHPHLKDWPPPMPTVNRTSRDLTDMTSNSLTPACLDLLNRWSQSQESLSMASMAPKTRSLRASPSGTEQYYEPSLFEPEGLTMRHLNKSVSEGQNLKRRKEDRNKEDEDDDDDFEDDDESEEDIDRVHARTRVRNNDSGEMQARSSSIVPINAGRELRETHHDRYQSPKRRRTEMNDYNVRSLTPDVAPPSVNIFGNISSNTPGRFRASPSIEAPQDKTAENQLAPGLQHLGSFPSDASSYAEANRLNAGHGSEPNLQHSWQDTINLHESTGDVQNSNSSLQQSMELQSLLNNAQTSNMLPPGSILPTPQSGVQGIIRDNVGYGANGNAQNAALLNILLNNSNANGNIPGHALGNIVQNLGTNGIQNDSQLLAKLVSLLSQNGMPQNTNPVQKVLDELRSMSNPIRN
ncbi:hypothetical protein EJ04DRAFT_529333 [Polyplosphaeria fusca]|uniref:Uncharacterized protein n=1 Tax=Polyplosphaeria fusca TaxID=682080 RepID=A0A9P4QHV0_9PLEO|nr:hypothetical protein EJ04DRAFT_529333 [Polyplosphaeria fusca]